ncbi:hypothetical protein J2785_003376 [Burkholderia ambifaria]|nr:hypothetical protein [Burkholderia ambifaria]MDR6500220.1 hypothetical protein [Burkholderia ambifaria]
MAKITGHQMTTSASDSYLVTLNKIHSTNRKIAFFTQERLFFSTIVSSLEGRYGSVSDAILKAKAEIDKIIHSLGVNLLTLTEKKLSLEKTNDLLEIQSKFNEALKIEDEIKVEAKKACRDIHQKWKALSHPSLDPMKWIDCWVEKAAKDCGVNANALTKISVRYKAFLTGSFHGDLYPSTTSMEKIFTLADIATNRYRLDRAIRNAQGGSVSIHWDESYPKVFTDRLLSGTIESDHDAALTQHVNAPGTIDHICDYLRSEMIAAAWAYINDSNRHQSYRKLVEDFLSNKTGAKPIFVGAKILDRLFLIQGEDFDTNGLWGVLFSLTNKESNFLELPKSRSKRIQIIEQNDEWLRNHLSLSDRPHANFIESICFNTPPILHNGKKCSKLIVLEVPSAVAPEYSLDEAAKNITENLISTIRSEIDYMTTTNAESWVDWIGDVATFVGIVATLALVPASILGAPHMVAAGLLTAATTAILPNIAKIVVHKDKNKRNSAIKEICIAITLEAIGIGISKAAVRIGTGIAKSGGQKLGQEAAELMSADIRTAITKAIGQKSLELPPTSIGENLSDMLNFIDDADIALEMVRDSTESVASWKKFGLELTDRELDSFMLKWGNVNALRVGKISESAKMFIRTADTASSTGAKATIDSNVDHGTPV